MELLCTFNIIAVAATVMYLLCVSIKRPESWGEHILTKFYFLSSLTALLEVSVYALSLSPSPTWALMTFFASVFPVFLAVLLARPLAPKL